MGILKFDVLAHLLPEGAVHLILLFRELGGVQEVLRSGGHGGTPGGQQKAQGAAEENQPLFHRTSPPFFSWRYRISIILSQLRGAVNEMG